MGVDVRTRSDDEVVAVDAATFLGDELPDLLDASGDLLATTEALDLRPLVLQVGDGAWELHREHGHPAVRPHQGGDVATLRLTADQLSDLVTDQVTPIGLLTAGTLDLHGTGIGRVLDWWLVLRCVLDGTPVHRPGDVGGLPPTDRSFTLDDDPAEVAGFLEQAGFVHLRGVFEPGEMAVISSDMDAAAPTYAPGDGRSWWARLADGSDALVRLQGFDERSAATARLLADERMGRIRALGGAGHELRWAGDNRIEALFKPVGVREGISDVPWHKDCSLGRHSYECCSLTVGVSVTGAGPGTGQLRVVAGSHRALCWPSLLDVGTLGLPVVPLATATGDVTVHLSCTLHMAEPPTVAERRVLYSGAALPARDRAAAAAAHRRLMATARERAPLTTSQPPSGGR